MAKIKNVYNKIRAYIGNKLQYLSTSSDILVENITIPEMVEIDRKLFNTSNDSKFFTTPKYKDQFEFMIKDLEDVGLTDYSLVNSPMILSYLPGDVIEVSTDEYRPDGPSLTFFMIVVDFSDNFKFTTVPKLPTELEKGWRPSKVFRPNINQINDELIANIDNAFSNQGFNPEIDSPIVAPSTTEIHSDDGFLQIGDLKFLVTPTQISFTTQNAYQYFPTLRTNGNPKVPTMQEVKSIDVNIIFPNADMINNQLIPLFAMYKRTPFVNIYNRDVCLFFSELLDDNSKYLPVALESISCQYVTGFPNTIQANITFLPFQYRGVGDEFRVLKTYADVKRQQYNGRDKQDDHIINKSKYKLYSQDDNYPNRLEDIVDELVESTDNFEESIPFRAFYQSIIRGRNFITDSVGDVVYNADGKKIPLSTFKPKLEANYLNEYIPSNNIAKDISFSYSYIGETPREFSEKIKKDYDEYYKTLSEDVNIMSKMMRDTDDDQFKDKLKLMFTGREVLMRNLSQQINSRTNGIYEYLTSFGIDVQKDTNAEITGLFSYLFQYNYVGSTVDNIVQGTTIVNKIKDGEFSAEEIRILNPSARTTVYFEGDDINSAQPLTIDALCRKIANKISENFNRSDQRDQDNWAAVMDDIVNNLLSQSYINRNYVSGPSVPTKQDTIELMSDYDVITGWSLNFANKFIPITLTGYKYPFYQHIGSDDIQIGLNIESIQNNIKNGLKEQLSLLNDRLQNSAKIVLQNVPELINELDPRITIDCPEGHIFDVFNLKKVVFNGSNVASKPGHPGTWNINMNLTQSNFTVKDYHSIETHKNRTDIEDELINFLLRVEINGDNVSVINYRVDLDKMRQLFIEANTESFEKQLKDADEKLAFINPRLDELNTKLETLDPLLDINEIQQINSEMAQLRKEQKLYQDVDINFGMKLNQLEETQFGDILKKFDLSADDINGDMFLFNNKQFKETNYQKSNMNLLNILYNQALHDSIEDIDDNTQVRIGTRTDTRDAISLGFLVKTESAELTVQAKEMLRDPYMRTIISNIKSRFNALYEYEIEAVLNIYKLRKNWIRTHTGVFDYAAQKVLADRVTDDGSNPSLGDDGILNGIGDGSNIVLGALSEFTSRMWDFYTGKQFANDISLKIVETYDKSILKLLRRIKYSYMDNFAKSIIRDPLIRTKLFGNKYDTQIERTYNSKGANCYNDFDIPEAFLKKGDLDTDFSFSPDFYFFNKSLSDVKKLTYAKGAIQQFSNMAKIANQMTLVENREVLDELREIDDSVFANKSDPIRKKLLDDLDITDTGADSGDVGNDYDDIEIRLNKLQTAYIKLLGDEENNENPLDPLKVKFNLIASARNKRVLQLIAIRKSIDDALQEGTGKENANISNIQFGDRDEKVLNTLLDNSADAIRRLSKHIQSYMDLYVGNKSEIETEMKNIVNDTTVMRFEKMVYTIITELITLGTALDAMNQGELNTDIANTIPELGMLKWFNWRTIADVNDHQIKLIRDLLDEKSNKISNSTSILYPTYKIFFVEEDSKLVRNLSDYYSQNAIQSIEFVDNKYSAGNVAVLKLSNVIGNLTDKLSYIREGSLFDELSANDNLFFGSLDIKPGTKMIIKMGYAANDTNLTTVFVGRIMEMTPGPVTQIIAQSFGAQLNHHITKMDFGFRSSRNEHGDIASHVLDSIPKLEGMGTPDPLGVTQTRFTGRNAIEGIVADPFNKFLLSNFTNRLSAAMFSADNPRDDNIFLPVSLHRSMWNKVTFDWKVFEQSVWNSLQELSLFHQNTNPIVRLYNDDKYSSLDDLRETLVVGNKSGFYKNTDSFSLSSMNIDKIKNIVEEYNTKIAPLMLELADMSNAIEDEFIVLNDEDEYVDARTYVYTDKSKTIIKFFDDRYNTMVVVSQYLRIMDLSSGFLTYLGNQIEDWLPGGLLPDDLSLFQSDGVKLLVILNNMVGSYNEIISGNDFGFIDTFSDVLKSEYIYKHFAPGGILAELDTDDVAHVEPFRTNNTDNLLANDNRYTRIQKHHYVTDAADIISNNIALSDQFKNTVTLHHLPEPEHMTLAGMSRETIQQLSSFTVKAFGELNDGDTRILETFQKNVDTNWWDIREESENFLEEYKAMRNTKDNSVPNKIDHKYIPAYLSVPINLLRLEVEKMYRGTITLVGNPNIRSMDIIHMNDLMNGMTGAIEVEEVVHSFNPMNGFTTTITPSLITYDRDPVTLADVNTIERILDYADTARSSVRNKQIVTGSLLTLGAIGATAGALFSGGAGAAAGIGTKVLAGASIFTAFSSAWQAFINPEKRYAQFIYDHMANVMGRDCINFSALTHHGVPFMCGFGGKNYTQLKSLINHQWRDGNVIQRYATSNDVEMKWIASQGNLGLLSSVREIIKDTPYLGGAAKFYSLVFNSNNFGDYGSSLNTDDL